MSKTIEQFLLERVFNDTMLGEMANYDESDTGLLPKIWVDEKSENLTHGPRVIGDTR